MIKIIPIWEVDSLFSHTIYIYIHIIIYIHSIILWYQLVSISSRKREHVTRIRNYFRMGENFRSDFQHWMLYTSKWPKVVFLPVFSILTYAQSSLPLSINWELCYLGMGQNWVALLDVYSTTSNKIYVLPSPGALILTHTHLDKSSMRPDSQCFVQVEVIFTWVVIRYPQ